MNRRSFLQALMLAPIVAPAAAKSLAETSSLPCLEGFAGIAPLSGNLGTITSGVLRSGNGAMSIDFERGIMFVDSFVVPTPPDREYIGFGLEDDEAGEYDDWHEQMMEAAE